MTDLEVRLDHRARVQVPQRAHMDPAQRDAANPLWLTVDDGADERRRGRLRRAHSRVRRRARRPDVPITDEPVEQVRRDNRALRVRCNEDNVRGAKVRHPFLVLCERGV